MKPRHLSLPALGWLSFCAAPLALAQDAAPAMPTQTITILDTGSEPREEIRYRFTEGQTEQAQMDLDLSMSMSMAGQQIPVMAIPTVRTTLAIRTTEIDEDGNARFEFDVSGAEMVGEDSAGLGAALGAGLDQMGNVSGWARVDPRGQTLEGGVDLPEANADQVAQVMDGVEQSMQQMSASLPDEAVGVGARWQVVTELATGGFSVSQTSTYTLSSRDGDELVMDVALEQAAATQEMAVPGLPAGAAASLDSLDATGSGRMTVDLTRLVPTSEVNITADMQLGLEMQGQHQQISMNMENNVAITPAQ